MNLPESESTASAIDLVSAARSKRIYGWVTVFFGGIVVIPPLIGFVGTVIGMLGAFSTLQNTGKADPSALASDISVGVLTILWGLAASALALIPFVLFLVLFLIQRNKLKALVESCRRATPPI